MREASKKAAFISVVHLMKNDLARSSSWHGTVPETVSLVLERRAHAFVHAESKADRNVTVRWKHDHLVTVLRTEDVAQPPPDNRPTMGSHSERGCAAVEKSRQHHGLRGNRQAKSPQDP